VEMPVTREAETASHCLQSGGNVPKARFIDTWRHVQMLKDDRCPERIALLPSLRQVKWVQDKAI